MWDNYVADADSAAASVAGGLQPGCVPLVYEPTGSSNYKGTVMLFHGFTACPQQFTLMAPKLQNEGYRVFLPVMPGMGYKWSVNSTGNVVDHFDSFPSNGDGYREFIDVMHNIMMASPGEKVIGGLSVGATVAAYQNYLGDYDRALLMAPLITPAGQLQQAADMLTAYPELGYLTMDWGPDCEIERTHGRAGVCQFRGVGAMGALDFCLGHRDQARSSARSFSPNQIQMIFVDEDSTADTASILDIAETYGVPRQAICGLDNTVPHAFVAPWDNYGVNMYWMEEVTNMIFHYLAHGLTAPQDGTSTGGYPRCDVRCTTSSCTYDFP